MGNIAGWICASCNAGEEFFMGGGMGGSDDPVVADRAREGLLGPAMKALLGEGIPEGWSVFQENCFYECRCCGAVIPGKTFLIDDRSGCWLVFHDEPAACEKCGNALDSWDEKVPLTEREIEHRCEMRMREGCSECGGRNILGQHGCWD